jgi:hypothetical protein
MYSKPFESSSCFADVQLGQFSFVYTMILISLVP